MTLKLLFEYTSSLYCARKFSKKASCCVAALEVAFEVAFEVALGDWLVLLVVQPATNKEAKTSRRTVVAAIDLDCIVGRLPKTRMVA